MNRNENMLVVKASYYLLEQVNNLENLKRELKSELLVGLENKELLENMSDTILDIKQAVLECAVDLQHIGGYENVAQANKDLKDYYAKIAAGDFSGEVPLSDALAAISA
jgi:hypothetical protein